MSLNSIRLSRATIDRRFIDDLVQIPELQRLSIEKATVSGADAFEPLAGALKLKSFEVGEMVLDSQAANRLAGIATAPALQHLGIPVGSLNDNDCVQLASSASLERVDIGGVFSARSLASFAKQESLRSLGLHGLKLNDVERDLRQFHGHHTNYVRFNPTETHTHYAEIYSAVAVRDLGVTMAGPCSCTCMDETCPRAVVVPNDQVRIVKNQLIIASEWLKQHLTSSRQLAPSERATAIRILKPMKARELSFDVSNIDPSLSVYLSHCYVNHLEVIDDGREIGVFGQIENLTIKDAPKTSRLSTMFYVTGVHTIKLESSSTLAGIQVSGDVTALRAEGEFPSLSWVSCGKNVVDLDLRDTAISDNVLESLSGLSGLRILKLAGCKNVTSKGIGDLKKALPQLEIQD